MSERKRCLSIPTGVLGSLCQVGCEEVYNDDLYSEQFELAELFYQNIHDIPSEEIQLAQKLEEGRQ